MAGNPWIVRYGDPETLTSERFRVSAVRAEPTNANTADHVTLDDDETGESWTLTPDKADELGRALRNAAKWFR